MKNPTAQKPQRKKGTARCGECTHALDRDDYEKADGLCWQCRNFLSTWGAK